MKKRLLKKSLVVVVAIVLVFALTTTAFAASNGWYGFKQVKRGDCDRPRALAIQNALWTYYLNTGDEEPINIINAHGGIDGVFGSGTRSAVKTFQDHNNCQVDGIVGSETWPKLRSRGLCTDYMFYEDGCFYYGYDEPDGVPNFRQQGFGGAWQVDEWAGNFITFEN